MIGPMRFRSLAYLLLLFLAPAVSAAGWAGTIELSYDASGNIRRFTSLSFTQVIPFVPSGSTNDVRIYPNPYVPYDGNLNNGEKNTTTEGIRIINLPANARIDIYDVAGRLVDFYEDVGNTGLVVWDARNRQNRECAAGVYIFVIKGAGGTVVRKGAIVL